VLSRRFVEDELRRGTLKALRLQGWPLSRTIQIIRLKDQATPKAVESLARTKIRSARFRETADGSGR